MLITFCAAFAVHYHTAKRVTANRTYSLKCFGNNKEFNNIIRLVNNTFIFWSIAHLSPVRIIVKYLHGFCIRPVYFMRRYN